MLQIKNKTMKRIIYQLVMYLLDGLNCLGQKDLKIFELIDLQ